MQKLYVGNVLTVMYSHYRIIILICHLKLIEIQIKSRWLWSSSVTCNVTEQSRCLLFISLCGFADSWAMSNYERSFADYAFSHELAEWGNFASEASLHEIVP